MKPVQVIDRVRSLRGELLDLAQALVRLPTVTGDESAAQLLAGLWREWGLEVDLRMPKRREVSNHSRVMKVTPEARSSWFGAPRTHQLRRSAATQSKLVSGRRL